MAYGDFKGFHRRTAADDTFNITKNRYQRGLVLMVYKFFNKKSSRSIAKSKLMTSQQILEELHKAFFWKMKKIIFFKDNI